MEIPWLRGRFAMAVVGALVIVGATGCVTGAPPPAFVADTWPVDVTVAPRQVSGTVGACSVTGTTSAVLLPGATVTVPFTWVDLAVATEPLHGLTVEVPETTVDAGTVAVVCPGAEPVSVAVRLRTGAVTATKDGQLALRAGDVVTFADPVLGLGDAAIELDGGLGELPVPGMDATLATFAVRLLFPL